MVTFSQSHFVVKISLSESMIHLFSVQIERVLLVVKTKLG